MKRPFRFDTDSECDNDKEAVCDKIPAPPKLRTLIKNNNVPSITSMITIDKPLASTVASPKHLCSKEVNIDKSFQININSPRRSCNIGNNYNESSSRKIVSPNRLSSTSNNYKSCSRKINSPRRPCSIASNYEDSPSRKSNSPTSRNIKVTSQRYPSREVNSLQTSPNATLATSECNKSGTILIRFPVMTLPQKLTKFIQQPKTV